MSDGKRPGGLTALAVLNFVIGGFRALGLVVLVAALNAAETVDAGTNGRVLSRGEVLLFLLLLLATVGLMIASGVGYLGMKRFLGRTLGNSYAVVELIGSALGIALVGFTIVSMIGLVYPVLTLILLNTTFKDDLVN